MYISPCILYIRYITVHGACARSAEDPCMQVYFRLPACMRLCIHVHTPTRAGALQTHTHPPAHMHICTHPHVHTSRQLQPPKELIERYQQDRLKSAHQIDGVCVSMHACVCTPQLMPARMDAHTQGSINGWSGWHARQGPSSRRHPKIWRGTFHPKASLYRHLLQT